MASEPTSVRGLTAMAAFAALLWVTAWSLDLVATRIVMKPLPVLLLLWVVGGAPDTRWRQVLRPALVLCMVGDVLLELPMDALKAALWPYGLAQMLLIGGLVGMERRLRPGLLLPPLLVGSVLLGMMWTPMGALQWPLATYALLVIGTAWRALCVWEQPGGSWLVAGALTFLASDALLGIGRFLNPLPQGWLLVVLSYWVAQAAFVAAAFRLGAGFGVRTLQ
jgi:alkenylglycerophosphocholine hydrolase